MTSFLLAFVYPINSLGPNNHGFQRICFAGTMTEFVFFSSAALEGLKIPLFPPPLKWLTWLQAKFSADGGQVWKTAVGEVIFYKENDEWFQEKN